MTMRANPQYIRSHVECPTTNVFETDVHMLSLPWRRNFTLVSHVAKQAPAHIQLRLCRHIPYIRNRVAHAFPFKFPALYCPCWHSFWIEFSNDIIPTFIVMELICGMDSWMRRWGTLVIYVSLDCGLDMGLDWTDQNRQWTPQKSWLHGCFHLCLKLLPSQLRHCFINFQRSNGYFYELHKGGYGWILVDAE